MAITITIHVLVTLFSFTLMLCGEADIQIGTFSI